MRVVFYLEDILIMGTYPIEVATPHCSMLKSMLLWLDCRLNLRKSDLTPRQSFGYLGLVWDSVAMTVSFPQDKVLDSFSHPD
jgi:hypothetical protein